VHKSIPWIDAFKITSSLFIVRYRLRECFLLTEENNQKLVIADDDAQSVSIDDAEPTWLVAVRAAQSKKATDIRVLALSGVTSFADYFVICTGSNPKQVQAIADEVGWQLKQVGERAMSVEGYNQAEWILADYGDLLIHVFSTKAREYYSLERLWRTAKTIPIPESPDDEAELPDDEAESPDDEGELHDDTDAAS
jgi:ribosome-associated protein